ncbi:unnamed protein product [Toxocara canis]|uniref:Protein-tyrosine phosphatase n=1 Tax=Toxocara canis TaxID=6265 RepID=A0A183U378_TOXCA|nr:unnamed protein product [Toxocara canis]
MPPFNGDFIHANWISSEFLSRKFICAQGPMENTIVDFWRMIWQEHIELIIMLCKLVEDGKEKCAPYWPSKAGEKKNFSGFTITSTKGATIDLFLLVLQIESRDEVTLTILSLTYSEETRRLRHFQWTSWPDCDAPRHLITPYTLHGISRTVEGPTVVHCSAGIGRSGTFIMLEIVYRCLRAGNITSVYSLLLQLRSQRAGSVQTFDQFLYIFYATIQRLINRGAVDSTTVTSSSFNYYF